MRHIKSFNEMNNYNSVNEGILADFGHWLGFESSTRKKIEDDLKNMDLNDVKSVDKLLNTVFSDISGHVRRNVLPDSSIEEKIEVLKAASKDKNGIGQLGHKNNKLVYISSDKVKWGTKGHNFGSGE